MRLCNGDRKKMCLEHIANPDLKQEQLAQMFSVERSTVSKILKNKDKWIAVPEADINRVAKHRYLSLFYPSSDLLLMIMRRPSKFPTIEKQLIEKLREISKDGVLLSDSLIRAKAREVALSQNVLDEKFKASSGWVDNFKSRAGIRRGVMSKATEEVENSNAPADFHGVSADVISPRNALHASHTGAEADESEGSAGTSSLRLQTSWSHHDLPSTLNGASILHEPKQGPGIPTLQDAETALDTVLSFICGQQEHFITHAERTSLHHLKNLFFQTGQGLAYHREY
jgi:transcriptional regulator with XRE-family HTH domain